MVKYEGPQDDRILISREELEALIADGPDWTLVNDYGSVTHFSLAPKYINVQPDNHPAEKGESHE